MGLALSEIDISLYRRAKANGAVSAVWTAVHPTEEVGGGLYSRAYAADDPDTYQYYAYAQYTGAVVLDSNYALLADKSIDVTEIDTQLSGTHGAGTWGASTGAFSVTYTVTVGGLPSSGVYCRLCTDTAGLVNIDAGTTNALGEVTFHHDLPSGTAVYIFRQKAGVEFDTYDSEVIP
jgi:hypothetical protein